MKKLLLLTAITSVFPLIGRFDLPFKDSALVEKIAQIKAQAVCFLGAQQKKKAKNCHLQADVTWRKLQTPLNSEQQKTDCIIKDPEPTWDNGQILTPTEPDRKKKGAITIGHRQTQKPQRDSINKIKWITGQLPASNGSSERESSLIIGPRPKDFILGGKLGEVRFGRVYFSEQEYEELIANHALKKIMYDKTTKKLTPGEQESIFIWYQFENIYRQLSEKTTIREVEKLYKSGHLFNHLSNKTELWMLVSFIPNYEKTQPGITIKPARR